MSASLFRSLASSWLGLLIAIVIGMLISPFVVRKLGAEDYGLWAFILALTNQFTLFELGAREAIISFVARARHVGDRARLSEVFSTGALFFGAAAILACLAMLALMPFLPQITEVPLSKMNVITIVFLLCVLDTAIEIGFGIFDATLAGSERYDALTSLNVIRLTLNALTLYIVLTLGYGIIGLAVTATLLRFLQRMGSCYLSFRFNPGIELLPSRVNATSLGQLVTFSSSAAVIHLSNRLIHRLDTVIAGLFLNPLAVTAYAVPLLLIEQFRLFAESGNGILTPRFSALHSSNDTSITRTLLLRWSRYSYLLASAIGVPLLITGPDFIRLWMGQDFPSAGSVLQLLTLPYFLTLPSMVFTYYLYATNRHALNARILSLEAAANICLSLMLVQPLGLAGIALGTLLPAVICRGFILPALACAHSPLRLFDFVRSSLLSCLPLTAAQAMLLSQMRSHYGSDSWIGFLLCNGITFICYCSIVWYFYFDEQEKAYLRRRLGSTKD